MEDLGRFGDLRLQKGGPSCWRGWCRAAEVGSAFARSGSTEPASLRDASNTTKRSLHLHAGIAMDAENGGLIGLTDATFLHRSGGDRARKGMRPFAEKQSRRWLDV